MAEHDGPLWRVLGTLPDAPKRSGAGYAARCPAHEDRHASLTIGTGLDGRVLLNCKRGCATDSVLAALGLGWTDLFEHSPTGNPIRRFNLGNGRAHVREDTPEGKIMHWETNGKPSLNGIALVDLPLYRADCLVAGPVVVCEGEKAAEALASIGVQAVGTVTGAASVPSKASLSVLRGHEVWLWPDNDEPGRKHMTEIALRVDSEVLWVQWPAAPAGGDAADYVAAGGLAGDIASLLERPSEPALPRILSGPQLAAMAFDAQRWAIPTLLPAGLTILAGRPKLGKSWLALGWALDLPQPALAMKKLQVVQGETLYLALEDGPRRMQERMALILGDDPAPRGFHVACEWSRTNEGGLEQLERWLREHTSARLIVVDTFKRIRPVEKNTQRLYDLDYDAIAPLAQLALAFNVAIVLVFHTRKAQSDDPLELVSGTLGVSGAADAVMVLRRERGQADASLFVTGRDVEEQDLALKWEHEDLLSWRLLGDAAQFRRSVERQAICEALDMCPGMTPAEIAEMIDKSRGTVRRLLFSMVRDEQVRVRGSRYFPILGNRDSGNSGNAASQSVTAGPPQNRAPVMAVTANTASTDITAVTAYVMCRTCGTRSLMAHETTGECSVCINGRLPYRDD